MSLIIVICVCGRIGNEESETELIQQLKSGDSTALLPETPEQLRHMINTLAVKRVDMPNFFVNGFLDLRLRLLAEHKKGNQINCFIDMKIVSAYELIVLSSLLQYESSAIKQSHDNLKQLQCPALILWGNQDRVWLTFLKIKAVFVI